MTTDHKLDSKTSLHTFKDGLILLQYIVDASLQLLCSLVHYYMLHNAMQSHPCQGEL